MHMLCCTIAVLQVAFLIIKLDVLLTVVRLFCSLLIRIAIKSDVYHRSFCSSNSHQNIWNRVHFNNRNFVAMSSILSYHDLTYVMHGSNHTFKAQHMTSAFVKQLPVPMPA